jgi:hypothetical protein
MKKRKKSRPPAPNANELADTIHLVTVLAAPNLFMKFREALDDEVLHKAAVESVSSLVRIAASLDGVAVEAPVDMPRAGALAVELEVELRAWQGRTSPSAVTVRLARELLVSLGIPEPAEGWDAFELPGGAT